MNQVVAAGFAGLGILLVLVPAGRLEGPAVDYRRLLGLGQFVIAVVVTVTLVELDIPPLLIGLGLAATAAVARALRRRSARRAARRRRAQVLAACEGLAADLAAGQAPIHALRTMSEEWPEIRTVSDAAAIGSDVPAAFRAASEPEGAAMLRVAAAAWSVSHRSGGGLADAMAVAADTMREEQATARVVATEIAAATATARLLALLPIGILILGRGMGGDPFGFLLGTLGGQVCLTVGLVLAWSGGVWLERIADQVEQA
jgi:tight adherence protein B